MRDVRNPFTGETRRFPVREPVPEQVEADEGAVEHPEIEHLPRLDMDGLDPELLDTLGVVLLGWPPDRCEVSAGDLMGPGGEVSLVAIPDALTNALAGLHAPARDAVADAWSTRQSSSSRKLDRSSARSVLPQLCDFAASATRSGRALFMWMSP